MTTSAHERPGASPTAALDKLEARKIVFGDTTLKLANSAEVGAINFFTMAPQLNAKRSKEVSTGLRSIDTKSKGGKSELDARWLPEADNLATALEAYTQELPESARGKGKTDEVKLAGERAVRLRSIAKMLESAEDDRDARRGGFNLSNLATAAGMELLNIDDTIGILRLDARHPLHGSLQRERAYLQRLLARCGVPNDPEAIQNMKEAVGFGPPPGSQEAVDSQNTMQSSRVLGCFAFGGLAIIAGLLGYFGNKENPKMKAMWIYLGLLGLCVAGKKPFLGTKEEAARDRIAFLGTPAFLDIAGPYGRGLTPVMERLFAQRGEALKNVKTLLPRAQNPDVWREFTARMDVLQKAEEAKETGKPLPPEGEPKDRNEELAFAAWKDLRTPVASGGETLKNRLTPDLLLRRDGRFVQFLKLTLEKGQSGAIDGTILRTMRDAKPELPGTPERYKNIRREGTA